jgi:hypothetical protein
MQVYGCVPSRKAASAAAPTSFVEFAAVNAQPGRLFSPATEAE